MSEATGRGGEADPFDAGCLGGLAMMALSGWLVLQAAGAGWRMAAWAMGGF